MLQRFIMIIVIVAIVLGGGFYAYRQLLPPEIEETQGPVYSTEKVIRGDISVGVEAVGRLYPTNNGMIRVPRSDDPSTMSIEYILHEYLVEEGDEVKKGQVIARLQSTQLENKIKDLEEQLENEKEILSDMTGVPVENLDNIKPSQGITLNAPISGRITNFSLIEGEKLGQGDIVAKVVNDSKFKIRIKLTPVEFKKIKKGQEVTLRFPYFDGFYDGIITEANPNKIPDKDKDGFGTNFIHWVTIEGKNPGLVQPGMEVWVGLSNDNENEIVNYFVNKGKVEGFVDEESIINQIEAIVTKVHVNEMDMVKKGAPIITMAGTDIQDMIQEKLDSIREKRLELRNLKSKLEMLEIKSPMDGVVARLHPQPGETLRAGGWMGEVYNTARMRMWVQVDDIDIIKVKQGAPVKITVDAIPNKVYKGEVTSVSTRGEDVNGITRFTVNIEFEGGPQLRPGMQANAYIDAGSAENVLLVPLEAVFEEDNMSKVEIYNPDDGTTKVVSVKLGLMNDRVAEVKNGLNEGDLVVTGSTDDLLPSLHINEDNSLLPGLNNNGGKNGTIQGE
ncbi:efflux RND transporter periplasmic adaptor subunit [Thermohalobacter berrensis]|uniref:Efflux transporter periplasmic adaptor subunit n=1 Tax=Thermohalobacter berrensis TaxID=99594 RepID=A0A419TAX1_9FIRM|nr:efflux RND transporter periplasmic adaptor subunit [Thermohalobacter berrensis]RKD34597.1 efflux transporter periplasmic adaptor subunit [Thermohalobacter berrensis]